MEYVEIKMGEMFINHIDDIHTADLLHTSSCLDNTSIRVQEKYGVKVDVITIAEHSFHNSDNELCEVLGFYARIYTNSSIENLIKSTAYIGELSRSILG